MIWYQNPKDIKQIYLDFIFSLEGNFTNIFGWSKFWRKVVGNVLYEREARWPFFGRTSQSSYDCFDGLTTGYQGHFIFRYLFNNFYPSLVVVVMDEDVKTLRL